MWFDVIILLCCFRLYFGFIHGWLIRIRFLKSCHHPELITKNSFFILSPHSKTAPRLNIQHGLPNHNVIMAALQHPRLLRDVPRAQIPAVELERHLSLLARLQQLLLEAAQHARGPAGDVQVQLRDFRRRHGAGVLERDAHFRRALPEQRVAAFGLRVRAVARVAAARGARGGVGQQGGGQGGVGE